MHEIQKKLLALAKHEDVAKLPLRKVGDMVGVEHATQVRHHLNQLVKNGFLVKDAAGSLVTPPNSTLHTRKALVTIPLMGEADCGEATMFATGQIQGYLSVSPGLTHHVNTKDLYALKAKGDSMDKASIHGRTIQDADYVLVQSCDHSQVEDGDYIVSIFNDMANIKRLHIDRTHGRIVLKSESHRDYPPIIIAAEDMDYYKITGKIVDVIKGVEHLA